MVIGLADYYERLVKEYLELEGFLVKLNTKFSKGKRGGPPDIDVIAINPSNGKIIVGEVKGTGLEKKDVDTENRDFNDPHLQDKVRQIFGQETYDEYIFCWGVDEDTKSYAKEKYQIHIVQFWEIVNYLINKVRELGRKKRYRYERGIEYPNLMLLQMLYHYSKLYRGKIRVNLSQLQEQ